MKIEYIIVHHTGAEEKDAEQVRRYHLSLGWRDVGYNYIIERDGKVVAGRSLTIPGAHCRDAGMNFKSAGVAAIGNLMDHPPTPEQWKALTGLVRELCRRHNVPPERVLGHNEVPGAATECPGRFIDMERLRAEAAASKGDGEATALGVAINSITNSAGAEATGTANTGGTDNTAAGPDAGAVGAVVTVEHSGAGPGPGEAAVVDAADADEIGGRAAIRGGPDGETAPAANPPNLWRVQVGAFAKKENAEALTEKLRSQGYDVYIVQPPGK